MKYLSIFALVLAFAINANAESNKVIVKFKSWVDASQFQFMGGKKLEALIPEIGLYTVELSPSAMRAGGPKAAVQMLTRNASVAFAQEDHKEKQYPA